MNHVDNGVKRARKENHEREKANDYSAPSETSLPQPRMQQDVSTELADTHLRHNEMPAARLRSESSAHRARSDRAPAIGVKPFLMRCLYCPKRTAWYRDDEHGHKVPVCFSHIEKHESLMEKIS
jgi:hypothetical protein